MYNCSSSAPALLDTLNGTANTSWTQYSYNYTATETTVWLTFGVSGSSNVYMLLDDVSVVDTTNPSVNLLTNPSFENSPTATGWYSWCPSVCTSGGSGSITNTSCRTGQCYKNQCTSPGGVDGSFLGQPFSAVVGETYNISFWSQRIRTGGSSGAAVLYVSLA